jgi:predicted acyltransferase
MIFPAFLLMVGLAIPFSITSRVRQGDTSRKIVLRILRRSALLFLLGLAVNGFPEYDWHMLRFPGILQRIAVCYLICASLYLLVVDRSTRYRIVLFTCLGVSLLGAYWIMLRWIPVPGIGAGHLDPYGTLPAFVDRQVFGANHLWQWGVRTHGQITYDPEGILSTIPALIPTLAGMATGDCIRSIRNEGSTAASRLFWNLASVSALLIVAGLILSHWLPLNKLIFTSSFALVSTGVSLIVFSLLFLLFDLLGVKRGILPMLILGTNAIVAFVLSSVITTLFDSIHVHGTKLHAYVYQYAFASWLPLTLASHTYALAIVALNVALIYQLYRRRLFLSL